MDGAESITTGQPRSSNETDKMFTMKDKDIERMIISKVRMRETIEARAQRLTLNVNGLIDYDYE